MTRLASAALFFTSATAAGLLRAFGQNALVQLNVFDSCADALFVANCVGNQLVYRISFSLSSFFLLTALRSCTGVATKTCESVCCLLFCQLPFYSGLLVVSLLMPNAFFNAYVVIARVSSALFIILQLVIIVDSSYRLRDYLLDKMDDADRDDDARNALLGTNIGPAQGCRMTKTMWEGAYVALVFVGMLVMVIGISMMYTHYGACGINVLLISMALLSAIVLMVLSVVTRANAGLLPSTTVSLCLMLLCYQAVQANPRASCAPVPSLTKEEAQAQSGMIMNSFIAAFTITWTSWQTSSTSTIFLSSSSAKTLRDDIGEKHDEEIASVVDLTPAHLANGDSREVAEYQFHVLMVLASLYMAMGLTNWGSFDGSSSSDDAVFSMWVKAISQWVASGLFVWTLVAPSLFPDREFS
ncbi:unnamed protein product [Hyaloperonospora brassicae]|uniref:RxLR effector candidate protein n=1 Tax=Hyaloperonospora brassicae TaxID=162125 RepID=A0AAV0TGH2_HYABA|nr:unnamed protein product [Hyaloperonospora brassicae]